MAAPGAEAALCEARVMVSLGKAHGFPHSMSRRNRYWLEAAWALLKPPSWPLQDLPCHLMAPEAQPLWGCLLTS